MGSVYASILASSCRAMSDVVVTASMHSGGSCVVEMHVTSIGPNDCMYLSKPPSGRAVATEPTASSASCAEVVFCELNTWRKRCMNLSAIVMLLVGSSCTSTSTGTLLMQVCRAPQRKDCHSLRVLRSSALSTGMVNVLFNLSPNSESSAGARNCFFTLSSAVVSTTLIASYAFARRLPSVASWRSPVSMRVLMMRVKRAESTLGGHVGVSYRLRT
mmetsp:Transcript_3159/g.6382  ORF Transcript_3159/g.6382 Transcript_3159/m.6382 type:complete len:216 (+) Transcript_3159:948-1595(+)